MPLTGWGDLIGMQARGPPWPLQVPIANTCCPFAECRDAQTHCHAATSHTGGKGELQRDKLVCKQQDAAVKE